MLKKILRIMAIGTILLTTSGLAVAENLEPPDQVLYDNGSFITSFGDGPGDSDVSLLQDVSLGFEAFGFGVFKSGEEDSRVADDFTVNSTTGWTIDKVVFFAYQTESGTDSTITGVNFRIWDGRPGDSSSNIIFGDTTTNRLIETNWTGVYRYSEDTVDTTRPVMNVVGQAGIELIPGTYWIDWQIEGSLPSGPWQPPITIIGETTTGNARQWSSESWGPLVDLGTGTSQGAPFLLQGYVTPKWIVTPKASASGSIEPDGPQSVKQGDTTTFTITPDLGYTASVSGTCGGTLDGETYYTDPIIADCTVEATFNLNTYTVTGTAGTGGSIDPTSRTVAHSFTTTFTVTPDTGYSIDNVTGCGGTLSGNIYTTGLITGACTVNALFVPNEYTISIISNPEEGGIVSGGGTYAHGSEVSVTATPNIGYIFNNWTENGYVISTDPEYVFSVTGNRILTANFSPIEDEYKIILLADPASGASVQGGGTYKHGAEVSISVHLNQGWGFSGWYENGHLVSNDAKYSFQAERDRTLTAHLRRLDLPGVLMFLLDDDE